MEKITNNLADGRLDEMKFRRLIVGKVNELVDKFNELTSNLAILSIKTESRVAVKAGEELEAGDLVTFKEETKPKFAEPIPTPAQTVPFIPVIEIKPKVRRTRRKRNNGSK